MRAAGLGQAFRPAVRQVLGRLLPLCRCKAGAGFRNYMPASQGCDALRQIGWFPNLRAETDRAS